MTEIECVHCNATFTAELQFEDDREVRFCVVCGNNAFEPAPFDDDFDYEEDQMELFEDGG